MQVVLIGATGFVGTYLLNELCSRGHRVTAVSRNIDAAAYKGCSPEQLRTVQADATSSHQLLPLLRGQDAVISTFSGGWTNPDLYEAYMEGALHIQQSVEASDVKRFMVIGGAGSLYDQNGQQLVDSPDFPKAFFAGASANRDYLNILKQNTTLDWTFLSPAIEMNKTTAGVRRGAYRTGLDFPVFDEKGRSVISIEDLCVAIVDELEHPRFIRRRFTVGY